jgi:hypothetical protein
VLVRPTASPISRIDGGYPRFCTESLITWSTLRWRQVSTWSGSGLSGVSGITTGTLPFGLRPGLPFGRIGTSEISGASWSAVSSIG